MTIEDSLMAGRDRFLGYIRARVSDPDLAEDILQDSLIRALRAAPDLRDEDRLIPWFYRVLHNAIVDTYRRRGREPGITDLSEVEDIPLEAADENVLCECFRNLIPTLKPEYADLIRMELADGAAPSEEVASSLGITANNLKVRRHRARQALRSRLEETCRMCAEHGCLDCTCRSGLSPST